jgi:hypothetical protein
VWGGIIVLIAFETEGASEAWSALHVERTLGGGAAEGAFGPAMLGLTMAVGRFSGHLISGRVSGMKIIVAASMFAANRRVVGRSRNQPKHGLCWLWHSGLRNFRDRPNRPLILSVNGSVLRIELW